MGSPLSSIFRARFSFSATSSIYTITSISKTLIRRPAIRALPTSAIPGDFQLPGPNQGLGPNSIPNLVRDNVIQWSNNQNQGYAANPSSNLERGYPQQGGLGYPQQGAFRNRNRGRNYTSNAGDVDQGANKVLDYYLRSVHMGKLELTNKVLGMYSRCGNMTDARTVFDHMVDRSMDSWHLMINGYASNGLGDDGLALFEQMKTSGLQPNGETFLAVEEGFIYFDLMKNDYGNRSCNRTLCGAFRCSW